MKQKIRVFAVLLIFVSASLLAASFVLVPHSARLYMASMATCQDLEEALRSSPDPQFEGIKFWEGPLARIYRLKYWHHGGPTKVDDWVSGETSVFNVFVTASDSTGGRCDVDILSLLERYLNGSRTLDDYDVTGYTALHQAIIFQNADFVHALLEGGADRSLAVRSGNERVNNKSAVELAIWFSEQEYSRPSSKQIAEMLVNEE